MRKRLSRTNRITVASTRIVEKDGNAGQSIEKRLNSDSSVGWYAPVAPNVLRPAYLISDVLINSHLILSAEGTMSLRIWSGPTTNSTLLITTGQTITNGLPHTFATHGQTTEVWVEFLGAGSGTISYGFAGTGNAEGISFSDTVNVTVVEMIKENISASPFPNPAGVVTNDTAEYVMQLNPSSFPDADIVWSNSNSLISFVDGKNWGRSVTIRAGNTEGDAKLTVHPKGFSGVPPEFNVNIYTQSIYGIDAWIVGDGTNWVTTPTEISNKVTYASHVWKPKGLQFYVRSITYTN